MKRAVCILCVGLLSIAVATIALDYFGEWRVFGYEDQVDTGSGKTRHIEYILFLKRSVTVQTNTIAQLAESLRANTVEHWEVAVRRPALRRKAEELGAAKLLNSVNIMSALLRTARLDDDQQKELVSQFLELMATKSPKEVDQWVDAQQALYMPTPTR